MKTLWVLGSITVASVWVTLSGCSSSGGGTGNSPTSTGGHTTTVTHSSSSGSTGGTGTGGTGTTTTSGGSCTAPATASDCGTACASQTPCTMCITGLEATGYNTFNVDFLKSCGCAAGSTCASACSADPACPSGTGNPASACATCLNTMVMTGNACIAATQTACKSDSACNTFLNDVQACFKLPKP